MKPFSYYTVLAADRCVVQVRLVVTDTLEAVVFILHDRSMIWQQTGPKPPFVKKSTYKKFDVNDTISHEKQFVTLERTEKRKEQRKQFVQ